MRRRSPLMLVALVAGVAAALASHATLGAFADSTTNTNNSFAAGTVSIADNDSGSAMFNVTKMSPGNTAIGCIEVSYSGSLDSTVRLYGTVTGDLASHLTLKVTRGTQSVTGFPVCKGFSRDPTDYIGAGPGVIYNATLDAYPASYRAGIVDPTPGSPETWTTSEARVYAFQVTLDKDLGGQGRSATAALTWEARNQ